jgi:hypothetical protein
VMIVCILLVTLLVFSDKDIIPLLLIAHKYIHSIAMAFTQ